ncbi:hydrogenase maturation protease [Thermodesulfobacteriota bacterium]
MTAECAIDASEGPVLKVLLIGFGNPAREDDGLGPAAAEAIEAHALAGITVDADYQLTVEDAAAVAEHDVVVFVDAAAEGREPFYFKKLTPRRQESFSSHSVAPEALLGLAIDLFNADTEAFLLGIRGYSFAMFREEMTGKARDNLREALAFLVPVLKDRCFQQAAEQIENNKLLI